MDTDTRVEVGKLYWCQGFFGSDPDPRSSIIKVTRFFQSQVQGTCWDIGTGDFYYNSIVTIEDIDLDREVTEEELEAVEQKAIAVLSLTVVGTMNRQARQIKEFLPPPARNPE